MGLIRAVYQDPAPTGPHGPGPQGPRAAHNGPAHKGRGPRGAHKGLAHKCPDGSNKGGLGNGSGSVSSEYSTGKEAFETPELGRDSDCSNLDGIKSLPLHDILLVSCTKASQIAYLCSSYEFL